MFLSKLSLWKFSVKNYSNNFGTTANVLASVFVIRSPAELKFPSVVFLIALLVSYFK